MKKILFTIGFIVFVLSSQVFSEDRFEFICESDNDNYSFDKNSIRCERNKEGAYEIETWIRCENIATTTVTVEDKKKAKVKEDKKPQEIVSLTLVIFKYPNREYAPKERHSWDKDKKEFNRKKLSEPLQEVIPTSIGETCYLKIVEYCKKENLIKRKKGWFW